MTIMRKPNKGGRPSKRNTISLKKVEEMARYGLIDTQIAALLNIGTATVRNYNSDKHAYYWPEFSLALKRGKEFADAQVVKSLFKRAMGYNYDEITYEKTKAGGLGIGFKKGQVVDIKHVDACKTKIVTKLVIPDVTAQIFWLKNRRKEEWRDRYIETPFVETHNHYTRIEIKDLKDKTSQDLINIALGKTNGATISKGSRI